MGQSIYNRWLVDFVAQAPHRHIGLAYLPLFDLERAVAEVRWAHEHGLKGVNFPAMRDGELPEYNRRRGSRSGQSCEELEMPLVTHVGGRTSARYSGLESIALIQLESATPVATRRAMDDLWRGLRTPSRPQAGHHRDSWQLGSSDGGRARRHSGLLRVQAGRAAEQRALAAGAASPERVHGPQRLLGCELRLSLRGAAGDGAWPRLAGALGVGLSRTWRARSCTTRTGRSRQ